MNDDIVYNCKIKGRVTGDQCFECYGKKTGRKLDSRVLCVRENAKRERLEDVTRTSLSVPKGT